MSFNTHDAFDRSKPKVTRWLLLKRVPKDAHLRNGHLEVEAMLVVTGSKPVPQDYEAYIRQAPNARWFLAQLLTEVSTNITTKEAPIEFPI